MKCPKCNVVLLMAERASNQIDYCPECRGVWLEQGKLDAIIERTIQEQARRMDNGFYDRDQEDDNFGRGENKRRGSFFSDLFD
jgi:Zn-finger nucleic acid-binding protein